MPTIEDHDDLVDAVDAVRSALIELRVDPAAVSVQLRIERAEQALAVLDTDLTAVVLRRLLDSVTACHRLGQAHSRRLSTCERSTVRALRLDPRWTPPAAPLRDAC